MTRVRSESDQCAIGNRGCLPRSKVWTIGGTLLLALISLAGFVTFWCTDAFNNSIISNLAIKKGSSMYDRWQRPPVRPAFLVRIFNYTNVEDFQAGRAEKLKIRELGPYVYRETLTRVNPRFNDDGTITYQEKRSFQWEGGSPDDEYVTVPNVPLFAAVAFARDLHFVTQVGLTAVLSTMNSKTFIDVPAGGFLWGYDNKIFDTAKPFMSWKADLPFDKFGMLAIKNGVSPDLITIKSGKDDINEVGAFQSINGRKNLDMWDDERCDRIEGTDGTIYSTRSLRDRNSKLKIYMKDMCRPISLEYRGAGEVRGVPTLTYKPPADTFTSTAKKDDCYCPPSVDGSARRCPPAGIFNSSMCSMDMPFLISFPHFYGADPKLLESFEGLNPRAEEHESLVEIHPVNVEVRKAVALPFLGKLEDGAILPLIWIDLKIDEVPDFLQNIYYQAYFTAGTVEAAFKWTSLIGILLSICSAICIFKRSGSSIEGPETLKRNVSAQNPLLPIAQPITAPFRKTSDDLVGS